MVTIMRYLRWLETCHLSLQELYSRKKLVFREVLKKDCEKRIAKLLGSTDKFAVLKEKLVLKYFDVKRDDQIVCTHAQMQGRLPDDKEYNFHLGATLFRLGALRRLEKINDEPREKIKDKKRKRRREDTDSESDEDPRHGRHRKTHNRGSRRHRRSEKYLPQYPTSLG